MKNGYISGKIIINAIIKQQHGYHPRYSNNYNLYSLIFR